MSEQLVLLARDPTVYPAGSRGEIDLTDGGPIQVAGSEGPQFGAATVELFTAEAEYGADAIDRTFPLRPGEIPLVIMATDTVSFDDGRRQIQAWVGLVQETGRGWIQRETAAGTLYSEVVKAELRLGADNLAAWGLADANALLTIETNPEWFGEEVLLGSGTITGGGVVRLDNVPGDYPARMRVEITDTSGNAQRSLLYAVRPTESAPTAAIDYEATALTRLSGSARTGYVEYSALPPTWVAVLSTDIASVGKMSHVGPQRVWLLVETAAAAQVRLEWAEGSSASFQPNAIVTLPTGATWVDLGEVQIGRADAGPQQWEGRVLVNASALRIYRLVVLPTAYASGYVNASTVIPTGASVGAWDDFETYTGSLDGNAANAGGRWSGSGASATPISAASGRAAWSSDDGPRNAVLLSSSFGATDMQANVTCSAIADGSSSLNAASGGVDLIARYVDANNWITGGFDVTAIKGGAVRSHQPWIVMSVAGVLTSWAGVSTSGSFPGGLLRFVVGDGSAFLYLNGVLVASAVSVAALASGGVLQRGSPGLRASGSSSTRFGGGSVTWDNFYVASSSAAAAAVDDAVVYPSQTAQLATAGFVRADSRGTAYARIPEIGTLPRGPVGSADVYVRVMRSIIGQPLPSASGDGAAIDVYGRPCFLFTP